MEASIRKMLSPLVLLAVRRLLAEPTWHAMSCSYPASPPAVSEYLPVADTSPIPALGHANYIVTAATHGIDRRYGRQLMGPTPSGGPRADTRLQSTKPQTVGYGLNHSPAGLAAWIGEMWRGWTDSEGDPERRVPRHLLLTMLTLFWATQSIASSMCDYFDNRWHCFAFGP